MRIRYSEAAKHDRASILAHTYRTFGREQATKVRTKLNLERLLEHPNMGRKGRVLGTRELSITETPFIAVYRATAEGIDVLRVLHGAQAFP